MDSQSLRDKIVIFIKSSPYWYKIYLQIRRKYVPEIFASRKTGICIEGYGRSGNTFSVNLIKQLFPSLVISSHVHSIAAVKLAFKNNIPIIVLIRDPKDCIASAAIKHGAKRLFCKNIALWRLREYNYYHEYILKNIDNLNILNFSTLISNNMTLINLVCRELEMETLDEDKVMQAVKLVTEKLRSDPRPVAQNAWSSPEKERMKNAIFKEIVDLSQYHKAQNIFNNLRQYSVG